MTSSHNRYSAQYGKQDFFRSDEFRCMSCGDYYPECSCLGSYRDNALRKTWQEWMVDKLSIKPGQYLIFSTLTFGCTRCGGVQDNHGELEHDYLMPGPQSGRKRFKQYWDELYTNGIQVEAVYGAEERGSFGGRLHYHSISRHTGDNPGYAVDLMSDRDPEAIGWKHGFSMIKHIDGDESNFARAVAYVTKYVQKSHQDNVPVPFFYYTYRPQWTWTARSGNGIREGDRFEITKSGIEALKQTP